MSDKIKSVYIMIDGVNFGTANPDFPNCAQILRLGMGTGKSPNTLDVQVTGGAYGEMSGGVATGRTFARAVILNVDPGVGSTKGEATLRYQTLFDVVVVNYKFTGGPSNGISSFTLSFSRSDAKFAWVPLVFSPVRFEDQAPALRR